MFHSISHQTHDEYYMVTAHQRRVRRVSSGLLTLEPGEDDARQTEGDTDQLGPDVTGDIVLYPSS